MKCTLCNLKGCPLIEKFCLLIILQISQYIFVFKMCKCIKIHVHCLIVYIILFSMYILNEDYALCL